MRKISHNCLEFGWHYLFGSQFLGFMLNITNLLTIHVSFIVCYNYLDRYEVYALRDATGYNKFRDKIFRNSKNKYQYQGEYS